MSAAVVPWAITRPELRMRRAMASLTPEERRLADRIGAGKPVAPADRERVLAALRTAYED